MHMNMEYESVESEAGHKEDPKKNASVFSLLTLSWVKELLDVGSKRPLENDDLFALPDEDKTRTSAELLQQTWYEENAKRVAGKKGNGFRLFKALVRMFPWTDHAFLLSLFLLTGVFNVLQPIFLSLLLPELMKPSTEDSHWAYIYAAGICLCTFCRVVFTHHCNFQAQLMSLRWKSGTMALIYKNVLGMTKVDVVNATSGYIINLIASDVQRFNRKISMMGFLFRSLLEFCSITFMVYYMFGWISLSGICFLALLTLYYGVAGGVLTCLRTAISEVADERVNLTNSIISGMRAVKMYAWEGPFMDRVKLLRRKEIRLIRWKTGILATLASLLFSCQQIAAFISLVALAAAGIELTSYNTFMILSLVSTLRKSVAGNISDSFRNLADFAAALARIQSLLELKNDNILESFQITGNIKSSEEYTDKRENSLCFDGAIDAETTSGKTLAVSLENVSCSWSGSLNNVTLKTLFLSVKKHDLVLITGPVGCGKSSLLYSILKEIPIFSGDISWQGKIAWVGQQPWVFSGTVRDNILFGEAFDANRYQMVLQACALSEDLQSFPGGDMTRVGERGIVLSGGQRARVELARAVYSNADIYLLDDPLSAVDTNVGQHIFRVCVKGLLRDKTRLMVTHNLQALRDAKNVIVMNNGSILKKGTLTSLQQSKIEKCSEQDETVVSPNKNPLNQSGNETVVDEQFVGLYHVDEDREVGYISWKLYWHYIQAGVTAAVAVALMLFLLFVQGSLILADCWLLRLTRRSHDPQHQTEDLYIFGYLVTAAFLLSTIRTGVCLNSLVNSSTNLHNLMLSAVLKAPILFFDTNPAGRVINRFSNDIGILDEMLPGRFLQAAQMVLFGAGAVVLPSVLNPWIVLPALPLLVIFVMIGRYYLKSSRDLRRLEGINRSPVLSHFSDTLEGLVTIRVYGGEARFLEVLYSNQDRHNQAWFAIYAASRWIGMRLDMICVVFVSFVAFLAIATRVGSGVAALSLVYTLQLATETAQMGVRVCSDVENYMTSVERVMSYTKLEQEPGYENYQQPPENWPHHGQLRLCDVGLVYYQGGPKILKDVSLTIHAHEKIGVVGRTGAGKSSLVAALFRMPQPTGDVIIDDVNISDINIQSARRVMAVITQNPVLFTGSLRMNLDPFDEYDDKELWDVLEETSLKAIVETLPKQLSEEVKECGMNFSVGERQLLCLARALLRKNKIIVMDEATANVDHKTDQLLQETIRTKFKHCTVITIAHRLNTIMDYDRVLVLENGGVVEYDKPEILLQNKGGQFSRLYYGNDNNAT